MKIAIMLNRNSKFRGAEDGILSKIIKFAYKITWTLSSLKQDIKQSI